LYPLLYFVWKQFGTTVVAGVIVSTSSVAALLSLKGVTWPLGSSLGYLAIWCCGALLAEITARGRLPHWTRSHTMLVATIGVLAIMTIVVGAPAMVQHYIWAALFLMCLTRLLVKPVRCWSGEGRIAIGLAGLGTISYSLYLVHFPLFQVCGALWSSRFGGKPSNWFVSLFFCVLSI